MLIGLLIGLGIACTVLVFGTAWAGLGGPLETASGKERRLQKQAQWLKDHEAAKEAVRKRVEGL